ncbi:MAG: hypothetical protein COB26_11225 [Piscirickettsiaceae bacterium]|nr:MAG: hypothetical protein COB89_01235 [Piscirickettsiaceae bacterium]PCI66460.1 MAG: hypothetical protein COB26_11225 [Piscirickettsiaceae bacterium]
MKILFKSPDFINTEKEREFFQTIERVTAYTGIEKMDTHFLLALDNSMGVDTIQQLFKLFDVWAIDKSPLESFVNYIEVESKKYDVQH